MLRRWHTAKWKLYQLRRHRKALKRQGVYVTPGPPPMPRPPKRPGDRSAEIQIPENFSIVRNPDETLDVLAYASRRIQNGKEIFLDMSKVHTMTPDAILYLRSVLEHHRARRHGKVGGNAPSDSVCRGLFLDSGFMQFVKVPIGHGKQRPDILSIKYGSEVDPLIAQEVLDFAKAHLGQERTKHSKGVYCTLIECMANSRDHAFRRASDTEWSLMALYDSVSHEVHFAFMDNGFGIPNTIRRYLTDIAFGTDSILIESALKGVFRTRTRLGHRGRGLPTMYSFFELGRIRDLTIVSRKGFVDCAGARAYDMRLPFQGTLITWTFI